MMAFMTRPHPMLLGLALALAPGSAFAGTITIDMAEGGAVSVLAEEGRSHIDAMRSMLSQAYPGMATSANRNTIAYIRREMNGATVARIEYTYEKDGKLHTYVYHARSGRSMKLIADVSLTKKDKGSGSSATETSDTDASAGRAEELDGQEAQETIYYKGDGPEDIRVTAMPSTEGGIEETHFGSVASHANDAELKVLRRIDTDIRNGVVGAGGKIDGFVSKTVCASCREAFNELARRHDVDGTIHQLIEPEKVTEGKRTVTIKPSGNKPIANSQRASIDLRSLRNDYANAHITKVSIGRSDSPWSEVSAIERAETSSVNAEEAEACRS